MPKNVTSDDKKSRKNPVKIWNLFRFECSFGLIFICHCQMSCRILSQNGSLVKCVNNMIFHGFFLSFLQRASLESNGVDNNHMSDDAKKDDKMPDLNQEEGSGSPTEDMEGSGSKVT